MLFSSFSHSGGRPPQLLLISLLLTPTVSEQLSTQDEQCEPTGASALPTANLLQISTISDGQDDNFGPGLCVGVKKSSAGSCVLRTRCAGKNISETDFSFVCFNPEATIPHAMHSFGRGGFSPEETFDTRVHCKTCMSVDTAFRTGDTVVKNALAALPLSHLPSLTGALKNGPAYSADQLKQFKPKEAAVFGPSYCISTFRAPAGTCLIRTRCANVDLNKFNVGITCLDKSGGYTRFLFGKDAFAEEETFDTLISCSKCLGVGPESSIFALHGLMPRKLVDDVVTLKMDVQTLNEKVRVLQQFSAAKHPQQHQQRSDDQGEDKHEAHLTSEQGGASIPTIMMSRRLSADVPSTIAADDVAKVLAAATPASGQATGSDAVPGSILFEEAGADTAEIDMGPVQYISHRRGSAIAELFRRAAES